MTMPWTKDWPTGLGWYWFYGWTSRLLRDTTPRLIPVRVCASSTGSPIYIAGAQFLYQSEGADGWWQPLEKPTSLPDIEATLEKNES